LRHSTSVS